MASKHCSISHAFIHSVMQSFIHILHSYHFQFNHSYHPINPSFILYPLFTLSFFILIIHYSAGQILRINFGKFLFQNKIPPKILRTRLLASILRTKPESPNEYVFEAYAC